MLTALGIRSPSSSDLSGSFQRPQVDCALVIWARLMSAMMIMSMAQPQGGLVALRTALPRHLPPLPDWCCEFDLVLRGLFPQARRPELSSLLLTLCGFCRNDLTRDAIREVRTGFLPRGARKRVCRTHERDSFTDDGCRKAQWRMAGRCLSNRFECASCFADNLVNSPSPDRMDEARRQRAT